MELQEQSPSTTELFDTPSPVQETPVSTDVSPEKGGDNGKEEKAVETETEDKGKETKEEESTDKDASTDSDDTSSTDTEEDDTTDYKQRLKETQAWGNTANEKAIKLEKEIAQLKEDHGIEETVADESETQLRLEERVKTSEKIERERYGNDFIDKTIYADDSLWQSIKNEPLIDYRVRNSDAPISEALKIVDERTFTETYGKNPKEVKENIRKELEADLRKTITAEFKDKLKQKKGLGSDLSDIKSDEASQEEKKAFKQPSTPELFG